MTIATSLRRGSPEFWLTPLIGLCLLGPLIWHWRNSLLIGAFAHGEWHLPLRENIALDIVIGLVPLLVAAGLQGLLRTSKWPAWTQGLAAGILAAVIVGMFYYYALYPLANWALPQTEGWGNDIQMYADDIQGLGIVAGLAVFASTIVSSILMRRRNTGLTVN